jgi:hypothetical protein
MPLRRREVRVLEESISAYKNKNKWQSSVTQCVLAGAKTPQGEGLLKFHEWGQKQAHFRIYDFGWYAGENCAQVVGNDSKLYKLDNITYCSDSEGKFMNAKASLYIK